MGHDGALNPSYTHGHARLDKPSAAFTRTGKWSTQSSPTGRSTGANIASLMAPMNEFLSLVIVGMLLAITVGVGPWWGRL